MGSSLSQEPWIRDLSWRFVTIALVSVLGDLNHTIHLELLYSSPKWVGWCAPGGRTPHQGF